MKKLIFTLFIGLMLHGMAFSQLTGTKTIPGSYATIAAAITDLNAQGVGTGGVTFNIAAGYTETFPLLTSGLITTQTGAEWSPIVFQRSGSGANPRISASYGGGFYDYIICIGGTDYVTFDGIDVMDASGATEFGYVLAKSDPGVSGTQHTTIKNCTITMNRTNLNSVGIVLRNWLCTALGTFPGALLNDKSQANSDNSFQGNTITDCFSGMVLYGGGTFEFYDKNNDIGSVTGNTITNFGDATGTCYGIYTQNENNMTIANNLITGSVPGGYCYGMEFQTSTNCSLNLYGNTISIQYLGTGVFYAIRDFMSNGSSAVDNTVVIHDNIITGCTFPRAASSTCGYLYIGHGAPNVSVYNNSVINNQYGSDTTASNGDVTYLFISYNLEGPKGPAADIYNNTVSNNIRFQDPTETGGNTNYMWVHPQSTSLNCYGNVCDNNTSTTNGQVRGINVGSLEPRIKNFYNNSFTNQHGVNGQIYCIYFNDGSNWNIYRNKVQNIDGPGANAQIIGMYLGFISDNMPGNIFAYNNTIADLRTNNATSATAVQGMWVLGGSNATQIGLYNNTIYLNSSSTGTNFGSAGLSLSQNAKVLDIRNNIIVNTSTPNGTGKTVALLTESLNFGHLAGTSNNNDYYAGSPSAQRLIFSDGTNNDQTLTDYKARVFPREISSVTENPPFVSLSPLDLHIRATEPTQCESGGGAVVTPIAVSTDFDGTPRYPNSGYPVNPSFPPGAPDIGADEFAGTPADLLAPYIKYPLLANTAILGNRTLTATITDVHGVPVSGIGLPRAYFKINSGAWEYVTGTSVGNDQYTFAFGGSATLGDVVYYYLAAQDSWSAPNTGSYPFVGASGYTTNPPAAATPPTMPNSYTIVSPICGTFTVGAGGNYATLTAAVNDINSKGITCPVTLLLISASYPAETFPITLQPNGGSSSTNTLTIKPDVAAPRQIGGSVAGNGIFKINGFDHLIIDGSASGGTDRNLTIVNVNGTAAGAYEIGLFNKDGIDPATNITVKNCFLRGQNATATLATNYGILADPVGGGYDNITISNNHIYGSHTGIQFTGNFSHPNHNAQITGNLFGSETDPTKYIFCKGILLQYSDNTLIEQNNIIGPISGLDIPLQAGIYIMDGTTNTKIRRNLIHDFVRSVDNGSGAYGIWYGSDNSSVTEISNNSIYGIKAGGAAPGVSPNNPYGIFISSGGNIKILYNSIWLYGSVLSPTSLRDGSSSCIGILNDGTVTNNLEVRNNIMKNSMTQLDGLCPTTFISKTTSGIATRANNTGNFSVLNHNDYYMNGCRPYIGIMNNAKYPDLASWQGATGMETNSISVDPMFTSASNLVPTSTAMPKKGFYLSLVPNDINGQLRTSPPDMGAYEFTSEPALATTAATSVAFTTATLNGTVNPVSQNASMFFDYGLTTNYGSSVPGSPATVSGGVTVPVAANITGLAQNTTYHFRIRALTFNTNITVYGNDMTFTTPSNVPVNYTATGTVPEPTTPCFNATNTIFVAGGSNTFTVMPGGSATFIAGVKILYQPGTIVYANGYMHGYISTGTYCTGDAPVPAAPAGQDEVPAIISHASFSLYPNPTNGNFTLVNKGDKLFEKVSVEVYNISGSKVMTETMIGEKSHDFRFSEMATGLYFVRIVADGYVETVKLVKL